MNSHGSSVLVIISATIFKRGAKEGIHERSSQLLRDWAASANLSIICVFGFVKQSLFLSICSSGDSVKWTFISEHVIMSISAWRMLMMQVFGLYLSTYVVVIISIDRCLAILDPISKNRAPRRVRLLLGVAWVLSAVFSIPQVSDCR